VLTNKRGENGDMKLTRKEVGQTVGSKKLWVYAGRKGTTHGKKNGGMEKRNYSKS